MSEPDNQGGQGQVDRPEVDGTLIDEMLRMTPAERLRQNDRMARLVAQLKGAFRLADGDDDDQP